MHILGLMVCTANKEIYESTFQAKLKKDNKKKGGLGYTSHGYQEVRPGSIPAELSSLVEAYWLNIISFLGLIPHSSTVMIDSQERLKIPRSSAAIGIFISRTH